MSEINAVVVCNCAHVSPTMPTCRNEHLYDCPVAEVQRDAAIARIASAAEQDRRAGSPWDTATLKARLLSAMRPPEPEGRIDA